MNDKLLRERILQWKEWERRWAAAKQAECANQGAEGEKNAS